MEQEKMEKNEELERLLRAYRTSLNVHAYCRANQERPNRCDICVAADRILNKES
jgi:hypothetical protein